MRKQRELLKHEAHAPLRRWNVDSRNAVEQHAIADADAAGVRAGQTGDGAQQRGLPRSRLAEDDRDAGRGGERDVELERRREARSNLDRQAHDNGATAQGFRINPYTTESDANENRSSASAVRCADAKFKL